ncbi:prepilin-type N-terminal cleavage/methylation domain-containing protein [Clostridium perfringens]|uniref:prepilin-type N-terminal cleavage/methylation domain-containing protein n=1 Tax=Clostridium perfringens TaxID=1502 RepID=UPI002A49E0A3|nr:prepilin-type N-terminal cleavage/methylation domain-containing protein [Clostridium perfringens]
MNTKKQNKKKKGFTLIELIIVIAIIAILAAIAIPNFLSIQRKAKIKADVASAKTIYDAASTAVAENKIIPGATEVKLTLGIDGKITPTPDTAKDDANALKDNLQTIPTAQSVKNGTFNVTIKADPTTSKPIIEVSIGDTGVYPTTAENGPYDLSNNDGSSAAS